MLLISHTNVKVKVNFPYIFRYLKQLKKDSRVTKNASGYVHFKPLMNKFFNFYSFFDRALDENECMINIHEKINLE